ncbi:hypothetical protein T01_10477, partial [Trichinella spiralis]
LAALSRGQRDPLLRLDLSSFARQWRVRHSGDGSQIKGRGNGHHDVTIKGLAQDQEIRSMTT